MRSRPTLGSRRSASGARSAGPPGGCASPALASAGSCPARATLSRRQSRMRSSALDSILGKASGGSSGQRRLAAGQQRAGQAAAARVRLAPGPRQRPGSGDSAGRARRRGRARAPTRRRRTGLPRETMGQAAGSRAIGWRLPRAPSPMRGPTATEPDDGACCRRSQRPSQPRPSAAEQDSQLDGQGHEPDDRG